MNYQYNISNHYISFFEYIVIYIIFWTRGKYAMRYFRNLNIRQKYRQTLSHTLKAWQRIILYHRHNSFGRISK